MICLHCKALRILRELSVSASCFILLNLIASLFGAGSLGIGNRFLLGALVPFRKV